MMSGVHPREQHLRARLEGELRLVAPLCRWTSGRWEELDLEWREIQNVPRTVGDRMAVERYLSDRRITLREFVAEESLAVEDDDFPNGTEGFARNFRS